ncbi:hypothetical protein [Flavobacterium sp.]|uniref:hypothetical protein n=1 Tax=Flavobacterium sp. TaxID=239 RepID=UPI003B9A5B4A
MKNIVLILIMASIFTSCIKKEQDQTIQSEVDSVITQEEYQRVQDSIYQAKQDSIAAVQEELKREAIERKRIMAEASIAEFTKKYMKAVSFFSGENPTYEIIDSETEYNAATQSVKFVFLSSWYAYPSFTTENGKQLHQTKGRITYYGDGEISYEELERNETLEFAISENDQAEKVAQVISFLQENQ